jgi:hypothetical protein
MTGCHRIIAGSFLLIMLVLNLALKEEQAQLVKTEALSNKTDSRRIGIMRLRTNEVQKEKPQRTIVKAFLFVVILMSGIPN